MHTAYLLTESHSAREGGGLNPQPAQMHTHLDADHPGHVTCDARSEANHPLRPWTEGMTDTCENIILLQTSFADAAVSPSILSSPDLVPQMETLFILIGNESCWNGCSKPSKYHDMD